MRDSTLRGTRPDSLGILHGKSDGAKDSLIRVKPIPLVGALEPYHDSTESIVGSEIPWIEYRYIGDLLWTRPGMYIRDMGSPGQKNELTVGGVDWRGIAFLVDGRSENDPLTGAYDMILFPTDYVERIEFITGPRAMLYGMNSTGATINVITKSFYTNTPYTRLRYSQGVDDYGQTDAIFSANIFPRLNLMFGLARHTIGSHDVEDGYRGRFINEDHDAWALRTKLRYDISNNFNLQVSHLYQQTRTGLSGGTDFNNTPNGFYFDDVGAIVSNSNQYEKLFNNHFDLIAALHPWGDTTQVSTFSAYYSNELRQYRQGEYVPGLQDAVTEEPMVQADDRTSNAGIVLRHSTGGKYQNFSASLQADEIQVESSPEDGGHKLTKFGANAKEEVTLLNPLTFALFGRVDRYRDQTLPGAGADAQLHFAPEVSLFGGASVSQRTPTLQELYWASDSTFTPAARLWLRNERHTVIEVGTRFSFGDFLSGSISADHRIIRNPVLVDTVVPPGAAPSGYTLVFTQPSSQTYDGLNISMQVEYRHFVAQGNATYMKQPDDIRDGQKLTLFPALYLDGSVYYRNILANGKLELKVGFRGRYVSEQTGEGPLDESGLFVPYTLLTSFGPSGTADFFVIGKLGDAYLHLIWENLSGTQYLLTPFYPMYDRNVRLGVSWEFWN
ncbi:MAG TPA: putative porin [Bacteroidota bacterium]|nr:putative porin [Bacteroidota bacterium]